MVWYDQLVVLLSAFRYRQGQYRGQGATCLGRSTNHASRVFSSSWGAVEASACSGSRQRRQRWWRRSCRTGAASPLPTPRFQGRQNAGEERFRVAWGAQDDSGAKPGCVWHAGSCGNVCRLRVCPPSSQLPLPVHHSPELCLGPAPPKCLSQCGMRSTLCPGQAAGSPRQPTQAQQRQCAADSCDTMQRQMAARA